MTLPEQPEKNKRLVSLVLEKQLLNDVLTGRVTPGYNK